ncbi:hypothetical protein J6590_037197, partial [Homalodisca vitripennis]
RNDCQTALIIIVTHMFLTTSSCSSQITSPCYVATVGKSIGDTKTDTIATGMAISGGFHSACGLVVGCAPLVCGVAAGPCDTITAVLTARLILRRVQKRRCSQKVLETSKLYVDLLELNRNFRIISWKF